MFYQRVAMLFAAVIVFSSFSRSEIQSVKLQFLSYKFLKNIPEPSDIVFDSVTGHSFIVSDHGILFECENDGRVIRKAPVKGLDFEGVEIKDSFVYVSDESPRKVYQFRKSDLSLVNKYTVTWSGGTNRAFESITYNRTKKCFVLVSQQPAVVIEYDESFNELARYKFPYVRDVSGARWHNGKMYLLSNLDACLVQCDPVSYLPEKKFNINVLNPEGFDFTPAGEVRITSDDQQRLFLFSKLPSIK